MHKAVILSAPSGSGKTSIVHGLLANNLPLEFSVSATSRIPRGLEQEGHDYYFLSLADFKQKIAGGEFIEWEEVYTGICYGTLKSEVQRIWDSGKAVVFDVDVKGVANLKSIFGADALSVFIQPPSIHDLELRLRNRGTENEEAIIKRLSRATYELTFADKFDHVVVNVNLEKAITEVEKLVKEFLA